MLLQLARLAMDKTRTPAGLGINRGRCSDAFEKARPMLDRDASRSGFLRRVGVKV